MQRSARTLLLIAMTRPSNFQRRCAQSIMLEMQETVTRARKSIAESRALLNKWRSL